MKKPKILLVDDDHAVLEYFEAKLGKRYELVVTHAAEEVLKLARRHAPQVIVCDIDMPKMDGGELSSALFADEELRDIPVLFLTALATPAQLEQLSGQLGGRPAVSKSEPVARLVARIEALLPH